MSTARFAWLSTDKAPLYVSLFFAALAWTLVRTADRIAATPIVEYTVDPHSDTFTDDGHPSLLGVRFRNMTYARPVNCLVVFLKVPIKQIAGQSTLLLVNMSPSMYRINGHVFAKATAAIQDKHSAELMLHEFPPGADVEFGVVASGQGKVNIKAQTCPGQKAGAAADTMPVIAERSMKTQLTEHELHVLWAGLALWALALLALATARAKRG